MCGAIIAASLRAEGYGRSDTGRIFDELQPCTEHLSEHLLDFVTSHDESFRSPLNLVPKKQLRQRHYEATQVRWEYTL